MKNLLLTFLFLPALLVGANVKGRYERPEIQKPPPEFYPESIPARNSAGVKASSNSELGINPEENPNSNENAYKPLAGISPEFEVDPNMGPVIPSGDSDLSQRFFGITPGRDFRADIFDVTTRRSTQKYEKTETTNKIATDEIIFDVRNQQAGKQYPDSKSGITSTTFSPDIIPGYNPNNSGTNQGNNPNNSGTNQGSYPNNSGTNQGNNPNLKVKNTGKINTGPTAGNVNKNENTDVFPGKSAVLNPGTDFDLRSTTLSPKLVLPYKLKTGKGE